MRMNADDCRFSVFEVADKVLDLVGVGVRRAHLNGVRKVENDGVLLCGAELLHHAVTDLDGIIHLGAAEALGGVLKADVGITRVFVGELLDQARAVDGDIDNALHVGFENNLSLQGRGGVIEVDDDVLCAFDRFKGLFDQMLTRLNKNLNRHIVGNVVFLDQLAADLVLGFRSAGEADLDFLEAHVAESVEEFELLGERHGVDKRLIAVAKIDAAPDGRLGDGVVRPGAVGEMHLLKGNVLLE